MSIEVLTLGAMVLSFVLLAGFFKLPAAIATAGSSVVGLVLSGNIFRFRHLVEGMFGYFDVILIIAAAMVFMKALEDSGILGEISTRMVERFGSRKVPLAFAAVFLVMIPGMLTGSSTAAALTTGRFVVPVLIAAGFKKNRAAALVALSSILGMIAPPVNIPVMLIGSGIDMPYVGFDLPLLILSIPPAIFVALWAVYGSKGVQSAPFDPLDNKERIKGSKVYLPLAVLLALMAASRLFGGGYLDTGIPLMFVIGTVFTLFCGRRFKMGQTIVDGVGLSLPVMGVLVGAGMFVQIMTLSGVRGLIVTTALDIPGKWLVLVASLALPLFGAVSVYASSTVMGVPIVLALLGNNEIVTAAALSLLAGLGDLLPPIAIVTSLVTQSVDPSPLFRKETIKACFVPGLVFLLWGMLVLGNSLWLGRLLGL